MVIIISAIGSNHIIGNGDGLPWHIPSEYNQFLGYVKDQTVIMGRRSYEIFKKDMLPERMVVVSRTLLTDRASVFGSLEEALAYSKSFSEDVYICGGQSIYEESIRYADYMYLSFIKGEHQGNVYFPSFDEDEWSVEREEEHDDFVFVIYRKNRKH
ncbi:MAG: dihydrofolate reductase [Bacteroidetes bacterium]|nr:dihydrofolate reductase [Bacteroidota bacterium]